LQSAGGKHVWVEAVSGGRKVHKASREGTLDSGQ
jgi:hypothetical protein